MADTFSGGQLPRNSAASGQPRLTLRPIVIGASTGGVEALYTVLAAFPADCPPVFVVQHMRPGFVEAFVAGLNRNCAPKVVLAEDRMFAMDGHVYVAPPGETHLVLACSQATAGGERVIINRLMESAPVHGHRPAADRLFQSAAALPCKPAAALLTGMGRDGAEGLLDIRRAGGPTIAQDRETCVVYGMPKAAQELQAADRILPLPAIGAALLAAAGYGVSNPKEGRFSG